MRRLWDLLTGWLWFPYPARVGCISFDRNGQRVGVCVGRTAVLLWRRGAVSLVVRGSIALQVLFGDTDGKAPHLPRPRRSEAVEALAKAVDRLEGRRHRAGQPRVRVTVDGVEIGPYPYHVGDATEQLSGGRWS